MKERTSAESWGVRDVVGVLFVVAFPAYFVFSIVNVMTIGHKAALISAAGTAAGITLIFVIAESSRWKGRRRHLPGITRRAFAAQPRSRKWFLWLAIGGPVLVLVGSGMWSDASGLRKNGVTTEAQVVAVKHIKGDATYFFHFHLENGRAASCNTDEVNDDYEDFTVGATVKIVYDGTYPDTCQGANYGTGNDLKLGVAFTGVGTAAIPIAIWLFIYVRLRYTRNQRQAEARSI